MGRDKGREECVSGRRRSESIKGLRGLVETCQIENEEKKGGG